MRFSFLYEALIVLIAAYLAAPILLVITELFSESGSFQFPPTSLTTHWFVTFFTSDTFLNAFRVSLTVATVVALLATVAGGMIAIALVRFAGRGKTIVETMFLTPVLIPGVLLGAALLLFFWHTGLRGTYAALICGHLVIAIPYTIQTIVAGLKGLGSGLEEAAMSLGATPFEAFRKATLPLIRSSLVAGAVFAFVTSFGDINLALFLAGPGTTTLPLVIFADVTQLGGLPTVAAASTLQIALIAALLVIFRRAIKLRVAQR